MPWHVKCYACLCGLLCLLSLQGDQREMEEEVEGAEKRISKSSQKGLKAGWTRGTFILRKDHLEKIKSLAYWERKQVKEVMDEVLEDYLSRKRIKPMRSK
jgi:hypothetical protein